ncbi:MAG: entericidin EcnA/B family protein [Paracoccaceae bacterium]
MMKFLMIGLLLVVSACATVEGMGRDISSGARTVEQMF